MSQATVFKKLVIVGDGSVGKTCLLWAFKSDEFKDDYEPTVFETYAVDFAIGKKQMKLALWDTAGQEEYDKLRPLSYPETDVVLICYSIDSPSSFKNVEEKWWHEIKYFLDGIPFMLVANKKDLRGSEEVISKLAQNKEALVTYQEGLELSQAIGAKMFVECSSKTRENVVELFERAARITLKSQPLKCTLL